MSDANVFHFISIINIITSRHFKPESDDHANKQNYKLDNYALSLAMTAIQSHETGYGSRESFTGHYYVG